jgi:hypothetical protein
MNGGLIGKVGSVFKLHQGMVIVGVPYSEQRLRVTLSTHQGLFRG